MKIVLSVNNVTKTFDKGTRAEVKAVQNVDLKITEGDIVLIMGPSGSGKTTLLTMLGGLLHPTEGSIKFQEEPIETLTNNALTRMRRYNIGFIFQSFNLLQNLSAIENVMVGGFAVKNRHKKAKDLLKRLGLEQRMYAKPDNLSGGERQRVAIARALINNPPLILADEPTANLDAKTGHEVMRLLCEIACMEGKAVIIVSHDQRLKDVAKRVITIEDGKLTREEKGGHDKTCPMKHGEAGHEVIK